LADPRSSYQSSSKADERLCHDNDLVFRMILGGSLPEGCPQHSCDLPWGGIRFDGREDEHADKFRSLSRKEVGIVALARRRRFEEIDSEPGDVALEIGSGS
jgi:hypothetical protein